MFFDLNTHRTNLIYISETLDKLPSDELLPVYIYFFRITMTHKTFQIILFELVGKKRREYTCTVRYE